LILVWFIIKTRTTSHGIHSANDRVLRNKLTVILVQYFRTTFFPISGGLPEKRLSGRCLKATGPSLIISCFLAGINAGRKNAKCEVIQQFGCFYEGQPAILVGSQTILGPDGCYLFCGLRRPSEDEGY